MREGNFHPKNMHFKKNNVLIVVLKNLYERKNFFIAKTEQFNCRRREKSDAGQCTYM
jgi:hypothetical protein